MMKSPGNRNYAEIVPKASSERSWKTKNVVGETLSSIVSFFSSFLYLATKIREI